MRLKDMPTSKIRKKQGISPVIASLVLVGVTIAISVGLGSWVFALFGGYSQASAYSHRTHRKTASKTDSGRV